MTGHEELIAMRLRGYVPRLGVYLTVNRDPWPGSPADDPQTAGHICCILVSPDEDVTRLDLRCLVGLKVLIDGARGTDQAVGALIRAAVSAGACRIKALVRASDTLRMDDQPASAWVADVKTK